MRVFASSVLVCSCLLTGIVSAKAQEPTGQPAAPAAGATAPAPAKGQPSTTRSDAAEARYRDWVEKEHARDATAFDKEKSKIENKYNGYVRPKREKKDGTAAKPAEKNDKKN